MNSFGTATARKMNPPKKKRPTQKARTRKKAGSFDLARFVTSLLLLLLLGFSLCAAGYVIFFRTVVAQEIPADMLSAASLKTSDPSGGGKGIMAGSGEAGSGGITSEEIVATRPDLPKVAIIIDDMGYDEIIGKELLQFPIELTYSFLPFAPHTRKLERLAHRAGKTVFLHLPLEPKDNAFNPGPGAIFLQDTPEVQREKLAKCLQEVPHAVGINNHMGSAFTEDRPAMATIFEVMRDRSLMFVDSYTTPGTVGIQTARQTAVQSLGRSVFLDNVVDEETICRQFGKLVALAEKNGRAIGIGHPNRATLNAVLRCGERYSARVQYVGVTKALR